MAAAGSSDPAARDDVMTAATMLAGLAGEVHVGYVATGTPRVGDVVDKLRAGKRRRVFIASYLLAPGVFHNRLAECGATGVAAPLGAHPEIVALLSRRFADGAKRPTLGVCR